MKIIARDNDKKAEKSKTRTYKTLYWIWQREWHEMIQQPAPPQPNHLASTQQQRFYQQSFHHNPQSPSKLLHLPCDLNIISQMPTTWITPNLGSEFQTLPCSTPTTEQTIQNVITCMLQTTGITNGKASNLTLTP